MAENVLLIAACKKERAADCARQKSLLKTLFIVKNTSILGNLISTTVLFTLCYNTAVMTQNHKAASLFSLTYQTGAFPQGWEVFINANLTESAKDGLNHRIYYSAINVLLVGVLYSV